MIETLADIFQTHGVLPHLTFDRDPRFVGRAPVAGTFQACFYAFCMR